MGVGGGSRLGRHRRCPRASRGGGTDGRQAPVGRAPRTFGSAAPSFSNAAAVTVVAGRRWQRQAAPVAVTRAGGD